MNWKTLVMGLLLALACVGYGTSYYAETSFGSQK